MGARQLVHRVVRTGGGRVRSLRKPDQAEIPVEGRHFRFRPTGEIEALSGDGRFSNTSDDFGRRFCSATTSPVRHVVVEDRYLRATPTCPSSTVVHAAACRRLLGPGLSRQRPGALRVLGTAYFMSARAESVIGSIERGGAVTGYFTGATGPLIYRGDRTRRGLLRPVLHRRVRDEPRPPPHPDAGRVYLPGRSRGTGVGVPRLHGQLVPPRQPRQRPRRRPLYL